MVEHAAERIPHVFGGDRGLDRLGDRQTEAAGRIGVGGERVAAGLGEVRRARVHGGTPDLHHRLEVGLLVVAGPDLPHLALDAVLRSRERQRRAPLARAGLGGDLADPVGGVVVGLRHRGVRLVRPRRADALVLIEDLGRGVEELLEPPCAKQRARPPESEHVEHAAGDVDVRVARHLLFDQRHREQRRQVVGPDRLVGARMQRRRRRRRQVGDDVVPLRRDLGLFEQDLRVVGHGVPSDVAGSGRHDAASSARAPSCGRRCAVSSERRVRRGRCP